MGKPLTTLMWADDMPGGARGFAVPQGAGSLQRHRANAFLDKCPRGLNRIEIVQVRRQIPQRRTVSLDQTGDLQRFEGFKASISTMSPRRRRGAGYVL